MKPDPTPYAARMNPERRTSTLFFNVPEHDGIPATTESGEYDMRGSIVFPVAQKLDNGSLRIEGYALVAGYDVDRKIIRVFEHIPFKSINF